MNLWSMDLVYFDHVDVDVDVGVDVDVDGHDNVDISHVGSNDVHVNSGISFTGVGCDWC